MNERVPPNRTAYGIVIASLAWMLAISLAGLRTALRAIDAYEESIRQHTPGADARWSDAQALYFLGNAAAEAGLVVAFIAGLVWLHSAWKQQMPRSRSARSVVLGTLVPFVGFFRLSRILPELARSADAWEALSKIALWWWITLLYHVTYLVSHGKHVVGGVHVVASIVQAASAALGIRMIVALHRALGSTRKES